MSRSAEDFRELVSRLLLSASRGTPLVSFLDEVSSILLDESGASAVVVRLEGWGPGIRCRAIRNAPHSFRFETERPSPTAMPEDADAARARLCRALLAGHAGPPFSPRGSYWCEDAAAEAPVDCGPEGVADVAGWALRGGFRSLALVPIRSGQNVTGLLQFIASAAGAFEDRDVLFFEDLAAVLAMATEFHRAQWALRERVKELTCLYGISRLLEQDDVPLPELLPRVVRLLPPGWQYPDRCAARIVLDDVAWATEDYIANSQRQFAVVGAGGRVRGTVEVVYTLPQPDIDDGPFLAEERTLIDRVAAELGRTIERREAREAAERLGEQLRHADRLKTIGTLTAGVAHELNEPLGAILGFAELAQQASGLREETRQDLGRIVRATLRAREIIKKLMFFGRQAPHRRRLVELNTVAREAALFVSSRLDVQGIALELKLASPSPITNADAGQLNQVLVNLLVNAIHAMPDGGRLTIATSNEDGLAVLSVADTGIGMTEDVRRQLFVPFFTTKDVGEGTGLGLSVVHGIVSAHGGTIEVHSAPGAGTRVDVRLEAAAVPAAGETRE